MSRLTTHNLRLTTLSKLILFVLLVVGSWSFVYTNVALAQNSGNSTNCKAGAAADGSTEYCLLAPIPLEGAGGDETQKTNANKYLKGLFQLTIGLAGGLAVLMLIYGGFTYITSDSFSGKETGRDIITNAVWGFLLAISAWLILNTINPDLVKIDFNIERQEIKGQLPGGNVPGGGGSGEGGGGTGAAWQDDASVRSSLGTGISVNKNNCNKVGDSNCTSVAGLSSNIISGLRILQSQCNCDVEITGGTEYWLHGNKNHDINLNKTLHKPGGNVVDLTYGSDKLNNHIRDKGRRVSNNSCSNLGTEKRILNGVTYVYETKGVDPHWHLCF